MKKLLLIFTLLLTTSIFAQVKIGDNPQTIDQNSILELESPNKVLVVTRITNAEMNAITPLNGAIVYNTDEDCLFQFNNNTWNSLCVNVMANETVTSLIDNNDGSISYTSEDGTITTIIKSALTDNNDGTFTFDNGNGTPITLDVSALETVTTLLDNTDGTFTYTSENGTTTTIDTNSTETLTTIALNVDNINIDYTDEDGIITPLDLSAIVANLEALTTLVDNNDGTFTYTDEDGVATTLDVSNLETLTTIALNTDAASIDYTDEDGIVTNINLAAIVANLEALTTLVDNNDGTFTYTDEDGVETIINAANLETLTTITNNGDLTYTYINEDGTPVIISVIDNDNDSTNELQDLFLNGTELQLSNPATPGNLVDLTSQITLEMFADAPNPNSEIFWNGTQWVYGIRVVSVNNSVPDANGNINIPIGNVYTGPTSSTGDIGPIEVGGTPQEGDIYVVNSDATDPTQVGATYIYDADTMMWIDIDPFNAALYDPRYVNVTGDTMVGNLDMSGNTVTGLGTPSGPSDATPKSYVDAIALVDNGDGTFSLQKPDGTIDTVSKATLTANLDGTYTFDNNDGNPVIIDVASLETLTTIALDTDNTNINYVDEDGITTQLDLTAIVANLEALTTLVDNNDGTFTYTDENGGQNIINVANLETLTTINFDATSNTITYTDEEGTTTDIILPANVLTTLAIGADGNSLDYTDELGVTNNVPLAVGSVALGTDNNSIDYTDELGNVTNVPLQVGTIAYVEATNTITYTDEEGTSTDIILPANVLTTLAIGADGNSLDYTDELGVTNNVPLAVGSVALGTDNNSIDYTDELGNVTNVPLQVGTIAYVEATNTITYTDEEGTSTDIILPANVLTTLAIGADGNSLDYTDELGVTNNVPLAVGSVALGTDSNSIDYTDELGNVTNVPLQVGTIAYVEVTNTITYTDEEGTTTDIILPANVLTTLAIGADGNSLDYTDELGVTNNVPLAVGSVALGTDNNSIDYTDELGNVTNVPLQVGTIAYVEATNTITYTDEEGTTTDIILPANVLTTLAIGADGNSLDNTDELGVTNNVPLAVGSVALGTDSNSIDYTDELGNVTNVPLQVGSIAYVPATNTITYTDEEGTTTDIILPANVLTTLAIGADGNSLDYTDELGVTNNVPLAVGSVALGTDNNSIDYTDELGNVTNVPLQVGTIAYVEATNTITYTDEEGTSTDIILPAETVTTITGNAATGNTIATYENEDGDTEDINETITTFVQNDTTTAADPTATGEITYTDEAGTPFTAQVVAAETDNQIEVGANGGAYLGPTVYTGSFIISAEGTTTITGIPFEPSQVTFVANANVESLNIDSDNGTGNNDRGIDNSHGTMNGFARNIGGTLAQQAMFSGGHGNSINDISRYASSSNCIGIRYGDQNGSSLGKIEGAFGAFTADGFTINVNYTDGVINVNSGNPLIDVKPADVNNEGLLVIYTAYK